MTIGYFIRVGDKTTCGGVVSGGHPNFRMGSIPVARSGDPVTCGKDGKRYVIAGGVQHFMAGVPVAGTLDSVSTCPCKARLIHSLPNATYGSAPQPAPRAAATPAHSPLTRPPEQPFSAVSTPNLSAQSCPRSHSAFDYSPAPIKKTLTPELIAVAGSQHDNSSGNKMMFIGQAVRELAKFKRSQPALTRTLVVFTPSYSKAMLSAIRSSASAYEAGVIAVTSAQGLIDYINHGKDRKQSPIERLALFSHGVPQRIAFGYELAEDARMSLDVLSYNRISPLAFSTTAHIDSYACRTGMGNRQDWPVEEGIQFFPQTNESLAQLLADHLQIKVRAFVRRSDYKNTWGSFEERQLGKLCGLSDDAALGEEWCRRWGALREERKEYNKLGGFTYQEMGAINPVISGDTPIGAPGGHFEFLPK